MNKETLIRKLTSRKLWMAVALFVSGVLTAIGKESTAETVAGLIMQAAAVVGYIVGEGLVDAKNKPPNEESTDFSASASPSVEMTGTAETDFSAMASPPVEMTEDGMTRGMPVLLVEDPEDLNGLEEEEVFGIDQGEDA